MDELKHHRRIVDMLVSMHSWLRDYFEKWQLAIDVVLLIASAVITARVFLDPRVLDMIGLSKDQADLILRFAALFAFLASLISLKADLRGRAGAHKQSAESLSRLKLDIVRLLKSDPAPSAAEIEEQNRICRTVLAGQARIPEKRFAHLKALHLRKIVLSRLIEANPHAPIWCLRARLWYRGILGKKESL